MKGSMSARAYTARGKKWHLWLGRGIATCGAKVIEDGAPFDPGSAHSCRICARSFKPRHSEHIRHELPNPKLAALRQQAKEKAGEQIA